MRSEDIVWEEEDSANNTIYYDYSLVGSINGKTLVTISKKRDLMADDRLPGSMVDFYDFFIYPSYAYPGIKNLNELIYFYSFKSTNPSKKELIAKANEAINELAKFIKNLGWSQS